MNEYIYIIYMCDICIRYIIYIHIIYTYNIYIYCSSPTILPQANVVHIPAKTSPIPIRRPLLKKSPGIPRFGYPSGILPLVDDSHEPSAAAAELSSLEIANKTLSADQVDIFVTFKLVVI